MDQDQLSIDKTKAMLDLMMDIAMDADDQQTFIDALSLANEELDRVQTYVDSYCVKLKDRNPPAEGFRLSEGHLSKLVSFWCGFAPKKDIELSSILKFLRS